MGGELNENADEDVESTGDLGSRNSWGDEEEDEEDTAEPVPLLLLPSAAAAAAAAAALVRARRVREGSYVPPPSDEDVGAA